MLTNQSSRMTSNHGGGSTRIKHKIIFLGDQSVGKTCIIQRYMHDVFVDKLHPTVGVDFLAQTLHIDDKQIRIQLWDTAGQERFRSLIPGYLRDANCAVIVYDITKIQTFQSADSWLKDYQQHRGPEAPAVLVGNQIDLDSERTVSQSDAEKYALENGMQYFQISAKSGNGVNEMFKTIAISLQPPDNNSMMLSNIIQNEASPHIGGSNTGNQDILPQNINSNNNNNNATSGGGNQSGNNNVQGGNNNNNIKLGDKQTQSTQKEGGCC